MEGGGLIRRWGAAPDSLPAGVILETGSEAVEELIAAEMAGLLVEVVPAWLRLLEVEVVSVGLVSLEEVEGAGTSSGLRRAAWMFEGAETELMWSQDDGRMVSRAVEEEEVVGGREAGTTVEDGGTGTSSCETEAVLVSLGIVLESGVSEVLEAAEVVSPASGPGRAESDVLVGGEEAAAVTETSASLPASGAASVVSTSFSSGKVAFAGRSVGGVETGLRLLGSEAVSRVATEGVFVSEVGVMDSEEVVGGSAVVSVVLGTEALFSLTASSAGVVAASVVHISVSTVLEGETVTLAASGTESEIVGTVEAAAAEGSGAAGADGAVVGLSLEGVFVSASCICASSFSGVLRPDVVGGGPGLRTGFGGRAGFPAASCADTLTRI